MFLLALYMIISFSYQDLSEDQLLMIDSSILFFENTEYKSVATTITALSILETGWFKSERHNEFHNYFSIKEFNKKKQHPLCKKFPIYCMRVYEDDDEGYKDALRYFRDLKYPTNRAGFLKRLDGVGGKKYAEDKKHVKKVKDVEWMLINKVIKPREAYCD